MALCHGELLLLQYVRAYFKCTKRKKKKKDGGTDRSKTSMAEFGQLNLNAVGFH